jgi:histone-lysine N-methyltransferase SETD1
MSRASAADFSAFFPAAPRSAKNKAKERERAKSKAVDSSGPGSIASDRDASNTPKSRDEIEKVNISAVAANGALRDASLLTVDDTDFQQGDLLNSVGSASSHASTASSVFSAPNQNGITPGSTSVNIMTPMTNIDSSPIGRPSSPRHSQLSRNNSSNDHNSDKSSHFIHVSPLTATLQDHISSIKRVPARDPTRPRAERIKYDPHLDKSRPKLHKEAIYTMIDWVCTYIIYFVGSVIVLRSLKANDMCRMMTLPHQIQES